MHAAGEVEVLAADKRHKGIVKRKQAIGPGQVARQRSGMCAIPAVSTLTANPPASSKKAARRSMLRAAATLCSRLRT